jgi:hypothetical protein
MTIRHRIRRTHLLSRLIAYEITEEEVVLFEEKKKKITID